MLPKHGIRRYAGDANPPQAPPPDDGRWSDGGESKLKLARLLTALVCAAILIYSITAVSLTKLDPWRTLGLMAAVAIFEMWHIRYPWGRPVRLGIAVALSVIAIRPVPEALLIFFFGSIAGRLVSRTGKIRPGDFYYIFQRTYILALAGPGLCHDQPVPYRQHHARPNISRRSHLESLSRVRRNLKLHSP